jgi:hypothetical protein
MADVAKCRAEIFQHVADMLSDTSMLRQNWQCQHPTNPTKTLIAKLALAPTSKPLLLPTFGWLLYISIEWRSCHGRSVFFSNIFLSLNLPPQTMGKHPPHTFCLGRVSS